MKNLSRIVRCGALACSVLLGVALALAAFWGAPGFAQNRRGRMSGKVWQKKIGQAELVDPV